MVVEVKQRLPGVRGLRDALAQLAGYLVEIEGERAVLWLADPKITEARVHHELHRLQAALRPEIADRVSVVVSRDGHFERKPAELSESHWRFLTENAARRAPESAKLPRADLQSEVVRVLILRWIERAGPVTSRSLQETVGCNYRTVAAALKRLGKVVQRDSSRRVELKYFPKDEWGKLLANSDAARGTVRYALRSGPARSSESLFRRLQTLDREDLATGGVLGAKRYDATLDLIGTPRLDITVHAPGPEGPDLDFVRRLDPALRPTDDRDTAAPLVLHFLRRRQPLFHEDAEGDRWADPVECLLDLHEARLEPQALRFLEFLSTRRVNPEPGP